MVSHAEKYRENIIKGVFGVKGRLVKWRPSKASEENRKAITRFDDEQNANGRKDQTRVNNLMALHQFAEFLGEKSFKDTTKEDVVRYVNSLSSRGLMERSIRNAKMIIRSFYMWVNNYKEYPECVAWIKIPRNRTTSILPEQLLSEEEIKSMIENAPTIREKAVISTLYESGCRAAEFLGIKIKDLRKDQYGYNVRVNGKTGERDIRLVNSVPHIVMWLKQHPRKDDENSSLWVCNNKNHPKSGSHPCIRGSPMGHNGLYHILKSAATEAGLTKNVHPHLLRHSRATILARQIPETYLRRIMGWTADSGMVSTYVHLNSTDVDDTILSNVYKMPVERVERMANTLIPRQCKNCGERSPSEYEYCTKCSFPLDEELVKAKEKDLLSMLTTPEMIEKLIEKKIEQLLLKKAR